MFKRLRTNEQKLIKSEQKLGLHISGRFTHFTYFVYKNKSIFCKLIMLYTWSISKLLFENIIGFINLSRSAFLNFKNIDYDDKEFFEMNEKKI